MQNFNKETQKLRNKARLYGIRISKSDSNFVRDRRGKI